MNLKAFLTREGFFCLDTILSKEYEPKIKLS